MKGFKRILALLLIFVVSLSGCSGKEEQPLMPIEGEIDDIASDFIELLVNDLVLA